MQTESRFTAIRLAEYVMNKLLRPVTADEIWDYACSNNVPTTLGGKTPVRSIEARLYVEAKKPDSRFHQTGRGPATFFLKDVSPSVLPGTSESPPKNRAYHERDLHPILVTFVANDPHFKCHCRTIHHERSTSGTKNSSRWLHPDIVGVYFPFDDYSDSTMELFRTMDRTLYKLFSFEMKKEVTMFNVREYYFQAISNSSWANEGYLVARKIDESAREELRTLNEAFGIGVIQLDPDDVGQSEILFPSRIRENLDGNMVDKLVEKNQDFKDFVRDIIENSKLQRLKGGDFDMVLEYDKVKEYCSEKGIL